MDFEDHFAKTPATLAEIRMRVGYALAPEPIAAQMDEEH